MRRAGLAALLWIVTAAPCLAQPLAVLTAERGDLRLALPDGQVLPGAALVGASLVMGEAGEMRIAAAKADPQDRLGEVWLFDLRTAGEAPVCDPDPQGERWAMVVPNAAAPRRFGLTCSSGAVGKCIRFGYAPWRQTADGRPMAAYHAACVNMVRAAYGGGERAWTRDGTAIDVFDDVGVQAADNVPGQAFEAGWGVNGAVCVAHPRVLGNGGLAEIGAVVPKLAGRLGAEACTEARARALGALVFNRSGVGR